MPSDLRFDSLDLKRRKRLSFSLRLDEKYFKDILEKPNRITSAVASADITVNQKDIFVNGKVSGSRALVCGRCNKEFNGTFEEPFSEILSTDSEIIDIMSIVNQALALTEEIRYVCKESCKGLCAKCGADLNEQKCGCKTERFSPFAILKK